MSKHKKYVAVLMQIEVYDKITDRQIRRYVRHIDNPESVKWISRLVMWAMINNKYLIIEKKEYKNAT